MKASDKPIIILPNPEVTQTHKYALEDQIIWVARQTPKEVVEMFGRKKSRGKKRAKYR